MRLKGGSCNKRTRLAVQVIKGKMSVVPEQKGALSLAAGCGDRDKHRPRMGK